MLFRLFLEQAFPVRTRDVLFFEREFDNTVTYGELGFLKKKIRREKIRIYRCNCTKKIDKNLFDNGPRTFWTKKGSNNLVIMLNG